jgi:hypothetical protein
VLTQTLMQYIVDCGFGYTDLQTAISIAGGWFSARLELCTSYDTLYFMQSGHHCTDHGGSVIPVTL